MRHFTLPSIADRQIAPERQASYNAYPYDDPNEEGNEPSRPSRINPRVPVLRISQAVDDKPSRIAFDGPAAPKTPQAVDDKTCQVASNIAAAPKTITPATSTPNAKGPKAQPLVVLVTGKKASSPERDSAQEANKASEKAESSATSLEEEETVGENEKRKSNLAAAEHIPTASTTDTEAVAPPTGQASSPETASVITTAKSHDEVTKDS